MKVINAGLAGALVAFAMAPAVPTYGVPEVPPASPPASGSATATPDAAAPEDASPGDAAPDEGTAGAADAAEPTATNTPAATDTPGAAGTPGAPGAAGTSAASGAATASDAAGASIADDLQTISLPVAAGGFGRLPSLPPAPGGTPREFADLSAKIPLVYSEEYTVRPFRLAAVTWTGAAPVRAWARVRSDGEWSQWYELPGGDDHQPDPGTAEAASARNGTDPLLVPASDGIQVRVDGAQSGARRPSDLRLDLVEPGTAPAARVEAPELTVNGGPTIYSRAQWGADESMRADPPSYGEARGAFVHHTVSANAYSSADVPALIRSIYVYHVRSRGWNDIGYNFVIDRFGRIWEGRYGGVDRAVIGAHTQGYNDDAFAASALGTYENTAPPSVMLGAYARLFGWKFRIHGIRPLRQVNYDGEAWPAIAGHRDAAATACPGDALYARLNTIRSGTLRQMGIGGDSTSGRDVNGGGRSDIMARQRSNGSFWLWPGSTIAGFGNRIAFGTGWSSMISVALPGDWDGDGHDDVIARSATGGLWLYSGRSGQGFSAQRRIGTGWAGFTYVVAPGDWDGDGRVDLIARRRDGVLMLYPGNGSGGFGTARVIGTGWGAFTAIVGAGDWNSDGAVDLIARLPNGALLLYPGTGKGGFGKARTIGTGWAGFTGIAAAGDVNDDYVLDLVVWTSGGGMLLYPGNGSGGFLPSRSIGSGWNAFDLRS
ncbi:FG-GAP-like repeat-containing protein [Jiangella sp. DSM 45060]|uniref:FG-GAP-like repeat-containing protein n=1 Tax=Jiangella sp. DSM 45060 TaxID=1798224 RepID=UPI00087B0DAF|nr:FG-GAP-like repeat-containing protein [Jiangella sp. DSM 45060]SDS13861.1 N-acetylmuramoyl-L-alanine amidase [Jiangella sp. DSM 45060]